MNAGQNLPALWRTPKFYSQSYPITNVATTHGVKQVVVEITKYLQVESLSRLFVHVSGNVVKAAALAAGVATGKDDPEALLVSANISTQPQFANCVPINNVSARGLLVDSMLNRGWFDRAVPLSDATGVTEAVDQWYELNFKRSDWVLGGIDYAMPLSRYRSVLLTLSFGGRDQLFAGGTQTWDLSGLNVDLHSDLDIGANPNYIHAHELFETTYNVTASSTDFKIDTLPQGFLYTDLAFLAEEAGVLTNGIINNVFLASGSQIWLNKGEANAKSVQQMFLRSNNRLVTDPNLDPTGIYALPLRDGMFTRGEDARFAQLQVSLDVTAGAASVIRLVGRRMIPGGIYQAPKTAKK